MSAARLATVRIVIATLAMATCVMLAQAILTWSFTERFELPREGPDGPFAINIILLGISLAATIAVWAAVVVLRKGGLTHRWAAAIAGGLLLWATLAVPSGGAPISLLAAPLGMLAGFLLSRADARPIGRVGGVLLACGLLAWALLLARTVDDARRDRAAERQEPRRTVLGDGIVDGAVFGSEVWLFNAAGRVASLHPGEDRPRLRVRAGVIDLKSDGAGLWALVGPTRDWHVEHQPAGRFRVADYAGGRWHAMASIDFAVDDLPLALALGPHGAVVLGPRYLYLFDRTTGGVLRRPLSRTIAGAGRVVAMVAADGGLYVGLNMGEFGGGLLRIDVSSGRVEALDRRDGSGLCDGPLNSDCDAVTALLPDLAHPPCLFAAIGVAHLEDTGRVLRVCGNRLEAVFERPILPVGERIRRALSPRARSFPPQTEPVFGLAPAPGGFWAITPRALYHWRDGSVDRLPVPTLDDRHGIAAATPVPGLVVVSTAANMAYSLSGSTPLLFAVPQASTASSP